MEITVETFLKEPDKYLRATVPVIINTPHGSRFLMAEKDLEEYDTLQIIRGRKAEIAAGNYTSLKKACEHMDKLVMGLDM